MKFSKIIGLILILLFTCNVAKSENKTPPIDLKEAVLGHMSDAYAWHITKWNKHEIVIHLPIIVRSQKDHKWYIFNSKKIYEGKSHVYKGFYINHERQGKLYEKGFTSRPLDLSITKDVLQIFINSLILIIIFISCAKWYKEHNFKEKAPKGFVGAMEILTMAIHDDVIKSSIGEKHYKKHAPYLLTVFFFILINNIMGLVPVFPGGSNITGNISITFVLAVLSFLIINIFGNREYWKEVFWPDVPVWMKVPIPLMPIIEIFGVFIKPFALMIRLFANMLGGHAVILSLTCVIFITFRVNYIVGGSLSTVSFILIVFMHFLELLVAFIQAYVFTMLTAVFIALAHPEHEVSVQTK